MAIGIPSLRLARDPLAHAVAALFAAGQPGASYAPNSALNVWSQDSAGTTPVTAVEQPIGKAIDKSGNANHALQATAAARPKLSARVNLATATQSDAGFLAAGTTPPTVTDGVAYLGKSASAVMFTTANTDLGYAGCRVGLTGGAFALQGLPDGRDMALGLKLSLSRALVSDEQLTLYWTGENASAPVIITAATSAEFVGAYAVILNQLDGNPALVGTEYPVLYLSNTVASDLTAYLCEAQANEGMTLERYQRVNTAADYDTAGFPLYEKFDGVDDSLSSATGGGATAGFTWCRAVKPTGGAGTLRTLWSDAGANTGYKVQINAANQLSFSAGNGTAYTTVTSVATVDVGTISLPKAWEDTANLYVQIGNGAIASIARPVVAAGTAGFTEGKDNGAATGFFNGNLYAEVYRTGTPVTTAELANVSAYCAQQAGL